MTDDIDEAKESDQLEASDKREKQRYAAIRALGTALTVDEFVMATASVARPECSKNNIGPDDQFCDGSPLNHGPALT